MLINNGQVMVWSDDEGDFVPGDIGAIAGGPMTNPMTDIGDTIYGGAGGTAARLAANTSTTKKFLTETGTGSAGTAPVWEALTASSIGAANQALSNLASVDITETIPITKDGLGSTSTDALILQNTTAASAGAQQFSPRLRLTGQVWHTSFGAASVPVDWIIENQPVQSALGTTNLIISSQINGGGYNEGLVIQDDRTLISGTYLPASDVSFNLGSASLAFYSAFIQRLGLLTGNGFVKTSGGDGSLSIDTSTYLTTNQTITLSGDVSGSGSTAITTAIGATKVLASMLNSNVFANPSASIGLSALNGSAGTAMRSDAAPALDVSISPNWTGSHTFTNAIGLLNTAPVSANGLTINRTNLAEGSKGLSVTVGGDTFTSGFTNIMAGRFAVSSATSNTTPAHPALYAVYGDITFTGSGRLDTSIGLTSQTANTSSSGGIIGDCYGLWSQLQATNSAVLTNARPIYAEANFGGTSSSSLAQIIQLRFRSSSSGTMSDVRGTFIGGWTNSGGGTVTSSYGIYIDSSIDIGTTKYAIYSLSASQTMLSGDLFINKSTANLYLKDTSTGFQAASTTIVTPQANNSIRSVSYTSGLIGWTIDPNYAEFNNISARGELHSTIFSYQDIHATAGTLFVGKSAGILKADATTAASIGTNFTIDVKDPDTGHVQLFSVNEFLRIKDSFAYDIWMQVISVSDQTTFYRYTVQLKSGSTGATINTGASVIDYGLSTDGWISLSSDGAIGASPNMTLARNGSTPWSSPTTIARLGDLNGSYGYSTVKHGLGIGQYGAANETWISITTVDGFRIGNNTNVLARWYGAADGSYSAGDILVGRDGSGQSNVYITAGKVELRNNTTAMIRLAADGSGFLANSSISWDTSGNLTVVGNASIGGFSIGSDYIRDVANSFGMASTVTGGDDVRFWAGSTFVSRTTAPLRITEAGALVATSATISGAITATSGSITGVLNMSGGSAAIAIGVTPPTGPWNGTGIWMSPSGITVVNGGTGAPSAVELTINETGLLSATGGAIKIDHTGLNFRAASGLTQNINFSYSGGNRGWIDQNDGVRTFTNYGTSTSSFILSSGIVSGFADWAGIKLTAASATSNGSIRMYSPSGGSGIIGLTVGADATPNAMLDVRGTGVFTGALTVPDDAYDATTWNGNLTVPTKNAVRDKIESMSGMAIGSTVTSATTGSILFAGASSVLAQDNANLFWDDTNNRLGIGTSSPSETTHIHKSGSGTASSLWDSDSGGGAVYLYGGGGQANFQFAGASSKYAAAGMGVPGASLTSDFIVSVYNGTSWLEALRVNNNRTLKIAAYGAGTLVTDASGNITASSDERLKIVHGEFTRGLSSLMKINPVLYSWNKKSGMETREVYPGYTTQNVIKAIPEAVFNSPSGFQNLYERGINATIVNSVQQLINAILEAKDLKSLQNRLIEELSQLT